ncbi:hypothetical protein Nwat_2465 [Nitrosococcus watsonii C-113]|uniref:Uncharacterized protein n=1 Tax=Nitrosococcus watsoni (strain C-113) TaxID=105559 RepID=D8K9C4_NITWC|nr:hypothetical protein Nwat_2465 [Nitrosococcus watsonii C-113]
MTIDAEIPVEATVSTIHRRVGEGRHDPGRTIAIDTLFQRHQANIADFISQPGVGQKLHGIEHVPILWIGDALEQADLGIA